MRDLGLVGLSAGKDHVLLLDESGELFRVPVDDALRTALRAAPRGNRQQVGISMDAAASALRPRDIQALIRAGESPESVAAVAEVPVERVMAYAVPVLAEREHVCLQARRSGLRRKHASGPSRQLGQAVDDHLRGTGFDPDQASWDSWRREDGRWSVTVSASRGGTPATFLFDLPGRYVFAHDDAARRLVGDEPPLSVEPEPDEPRMPTRAVTELPRAEPAETSDFPGEASDSPGDEVAPPRARVSALDRLRRQRPDAVDALPFETEADTDTGTDVDAIARLLSAPAAVNSDEPVDTTTRKRRSRRASVPSWDEIMFGSKPPS